MSSGPKAAAFAIFIRVYMTAFEPIASRWEGIVWICALLTMIVGNFAALSQNNIKRLLAYSSIAHAGYVLVAVAAHSQIGIQAAMFYLASYAFMQIGAFAVVTHFARQGERYFEIDQMAGLAYRQPMTAAMMVIFLLSLIGVPLTAGFFGKFYVFKAALDANLVWLTVLGLLNSAVAAYYYLRIIVVMYMHEPGPSSDGLQPLSAGLKTALLASAVATVALGVFPSLGARFRRQIRYACEVVVSRRSFTFAALGAATTACRRKKSPGFDGYAYVANEAGNAIAVVDLTAFAVAQAYSARRLAQLQSSHIRINRGYMRSRPNRVRSTRSTRKSSRSCDTSKSDLRSPCAWQTVAFGY